MSNMSETQARAPPELKAVAHWLRNKSGLKTRVGVLAGKRADYFKGKTAVKAILSPSYAKLKNVPQPIPTDEPSAIALLHSLIPHTFFLRITRQTSTTPKLKLLQIQPQQLFSPEESYVWLLDSNPIRSILYAVALVAVVLTAVMFPLWPVKLRIGVWYLSIGVLGLIGVFFGVAIVRLIFWVITVVVYKPGIWIFPNLFADVGFVDSFIPLWAWDLPPPKKVRKSKREQKSEKVVESGSTTPKIVEIADGEEED